MFQRGNVIRYLQSVLYFKTGSDKPLNISYTCINSHIKMYISFCEISFLAKNESKLIKSIYDLQSMSRGIVKALVTKRFPTISDKMPSRGREK